MKKVLYIIIILGLKLSTLSQISITQSFEGGGWPYTGGFVNTEQARTGSNSLLIGRSNNGTGSSAGSSSLCGANTVPNSVVFDPIFINSGSCTGTFSFYHRSQTINGYTCSAGGEGIDIREGFAVYRRLNGAVAWTLLNSISFSGNQVWTWTTNPLNSAAATPCGAASISNPFTDNVPAGTTSAQYMIITIGLNSTSGCVPFSSNVLAVTASSFDRRDEGLFIDDVNFTTVSPCVLPITLTDFYAKPNESSVNLNWRIETEVNVDHYIIERSNDGLNFVQILAVKSIAETNGNYNLNYSTVDENPKNGVNYYRLVNVDKDGSINYSKTIMVNFNQTHSTNVWINQTEKDIVINYEDSFFNKTFYLMDMNGKKIGEYKNLNTNLNYFSIDKLNLPKGLYVIGCLDAIMPPQKLLIN